MDNPYSAPTSELTGPGSDRDRDRGRWARRAVRAVAFYHGFAALVLLLLGPQVLAQGLRRQARLNDAAHLKTLADPDLFRWSESRLARRDLIQGVLLLAAGLLGAAFAVGLFRRRGWPRRAALLQLMLIVTAAWAPPSPPIAETYPYLLPALILYLCTMLLWLPRFSAVLTKGGRRVRPTPDPA